MTKAVFSRRDWSGWLDVLGDPATVAGLNLVGLPGRMRLPAKWRSGGRLKDDHLFYLVTEGSFLVEIGGVAEEAVAGDLLWIGPGMEFRCAREGDEPLTILRARLRLARAGRTVGAPRPWRLFGRAHGVASWFELLIAESFAPVEWSGPRTRGLLLAFFTELARLDTGGSVPAGCLTPVQRAALIRHVATNPAGRPTPRELAEVAGLSADYFARCFHRTFGQSPRSWLVEQRIRHAAHHLLETELRVGEVAREFGYADVFLFSRQFKGVMGHTPSRHRRLGGGGEMARGAYRDRG